MVHIFYKQIHFGGLTLDVLSALRFQGLKLLKSWLAISKILILKNLFHILAVYS